MSAFSSPLVWIIVLGCAALAVVAVTVRKSPRRGSRPEVVPTEIAGRVAEFEEWGQAQARPRRRRVAAGKKARKQRKASSAAAELAELDAGIERIVARAHQLRLERAELDGLVESTRRDAGAAQAKLEAASRAYDDAAASAIEGRAVAEDARRLVDAVASLEACLADTAIELAAAEDQVSTLRARRTSISSELAEARGAAATAKAHAAGFESAIAVADKAEADVAAAEEDVAAAAQHQLSLSHRTEVVDATLSELDENLADLYASAKSLRDAHGIKVLTERDEEMPYDPAEQPRISTVDADSPEPLIHLPRDPARAAITSGTGTRARARSDRVSVFQAPPQIESAGGPAVVTDPELGVIQRHRAPTGEGARLGPEDAPLVRTATGTPRADVDERALESWIGEGRGAVEAEHDRVTVRDDEPEALSPEVPSTAVLSTEVLSTDAQVESVVRAGDIVDYSQLDLPEEIPPRPDER